MSDKERTKLHRLVLIATREAGELGCSAHNLLNDVRVELGLEMTEDRLVSELRHLSDSQRYIESLTKPLAGVRWIITESGLNALAKAGL